MEQIIKLTGRIAKIFPANSGVSQRTGNSWMSQEYLFEFFSWSGAQNPDRVVFRIFGEDRIKRFNLQELEENITVVLRVDAHENDGRWYNEISATNIIRANQPQNKPADAPTEQQQATNQQPQQNAPQGDANGEGGEDDDLPF